MAYSKGFTSTGGGGGHRPKNVRTDRFGNNFVYCKLYVNDSGWAKGHCELGSSKQLYAFEIAPEIGVDEKTGKEFKLAKITKKAAQAARPQHI